MASTVVTLCLCRAVRELGLGRGVWGVPSIDIRAPDAAQLVSQQHRHLRGVAWACPGAALSGRRGAAPHPHDEDQPDCREEDREADEGDHAALAEGRQGSRPVPDKVGA